MNIKLTTNTLSILSLLYGELHYKKEAHGPHPPPE